MVKYMSRITKNEYYLNIAKEVSKRSTCLKRKYGAIIVKNDEIIATGYNGAPRGTINCCDLNACKRLHKPSNSGDYSDCESVHAEQNAMLSASRSEMIGAIMYLNGEDAQGNPLKECEPCPICRRMLMNSGISMVVSPTGVVHFENLNYS